MEKLPYFFIRICVYQHLH